MSDFMFDPKAIAEEEFKGFLESLEDHDRREHARESLRQAVEHAQRAIAARISGHPDVSARHARMADLAMGLALDQAAMASAAGREALNRVMNRVAARAVDAVFAALAA